jgi:hypothetical protein
VRPPPIPIDMTSDVKTWSEKFYVMTFLSVQRCLGRDGASQRRRLILLICVGWLPPDLCPSGACLHLGTSVPIGSHNAAEGYTTPGRRFSDAPGKPSEYAVHQGTIERSAGQPLPCDAHLLGHGPQKAGELTGNGHDDHIGVFALGHESAVTFTPPDLGFPTDVLDDLGWCFQSQLQMSADLGGVAIGLVLLC